MMMLKQFAMSGTKTYLTTSMRAFTARVFVEGLPADWSHHEIAQRFAVSGAVQKVNLVKNNLGQNTGKAIITFEQEASAQNAQEKFDNQAVDNLVVKVKPFYEKKGESPRKAPALLARRVYLMNLPYDATKREIEQLVKEFAEIDDIAIPRDK
jgi:RNA recognition motif-containing protein